VLRKVLFIFLLCGLFIFASNNNEQKKNYRIFKVANATLDGLLTEDFYKMQPAITDFTQRAPDDGKPTTEKTEVWVYYDDEAIYVGAKLSDSTAPNFDFSINRRDNWAQTDWFFFYVDPYHDKTNGNYFAINPGGTKLDGVFFNDQWDDDSWDAIWDVKTSFDNEAWYVEMRIPFSQLRFTEQDVMTWGFNVSREIVRKNETAYFAPNPRGSNGFVSLFADLTGFDSVKPKQRLEITPYVVQKAAALQHDPKDPFYSDNQFKTTIGADIKFGIGSNVTIDAAINPDFGQVEVDPAVLNLSAFETFFEEKRPFFIEGNNIFQFGIYGANNNWGFNFGVPTLFYSRRIGSQPRGSVSGNNDFSFIPNETRILGAAKLTGKFENALTIGALSAVTDRMFADYSDNSVNKTEEIEPLSHYGIFRVRKDYNKGTQGIGLNISTVNRDLRTNQMNKIFAKQAYTIGLDGWTTLDSENEYVLQAMLVGSYVSGTKEYMQSLQKRPYRYMQRPDAGFMKFDSSRTSMTGTYGRVAVNKQSGNYYLNIAAGFVTPGMEYNDLGFQRNADKITEHVVLGYRWYKTDGIFRDKSVHLSNFNEINFDGDYTGGGTFLMMNGTFENYYSIQAELGFNPSAYNRTRSRGGTLTLDPEEYWYSFYISTDSRKPLQVSVNGNQWGNPLGSMGFFIGGEIEWRPTSRFNLSVGPEFFIDDSRNQFVDIVDDATATKTYGKRYVFGELLQKSLAASIRLNYIFTPDISLQAYLQPFVTAGNYKNFKELAAPKTMDYNVFGNVVKDEANSEYGIDPDGPGGASAFTIDDPDFNFKSFKANVVLRWEVLPGSILYFAWTHDRVNFDEPGKYEPSRAINKLFTAEPDNVYLLKFSYWLDV